MNPNEQLFQPILEAESGTLWTWAIGEAEGLPDLVDHLSITGPWSIVVGYSKQTHNIGKMINFVKDWKLRVPGISFYFSVNMHLKIWDLDTSLWVGSSNLVQSTLVNMMYRVGPEGQVQIQDYLKSVRKYAYGDGTDLEKARATAAGIRNFKNVVADFGRMKIPG